MNSTVDISHLLKSVFHSCTQASAAIMDIRKSAFKVFEKGDLSPVTLADEKSNKLLSESLVEFGFPVLSEESSIPPYSERKKWEYYWCIDPLDGTKEFIKKSDEFAINVALIHHNQPILGVIALPAQGIAYYGHKELGVFKSTLDTPPSDLLKSQFILKPQPIVRPFTVTVSRSHLNKQTFDHIEGLRIIHPDLQIIHAGSSIKFCLLLENKADIYPRFSPCMEWDTAAGDALLRIREMGIFQLNSAERIQYNKPNLVNPSFIARTHTL